MPLAEEQSLTISPTYDSLEYRFKLDGILYTARYALSRDLPPLVYPFVFVRRPQPPAECGALAGHGPVIDAIEVQRDGSVIGSGKAFEATNRCPGQALGNKVSTALDGPPDETGAPLGDTEYGWRLNSNVTLDPGDEIVVTVLDTAGEPFEVLAGSDQFQTYFMIKLGALGGSGAVRMP